MDDTSSLLVVRARDFALEAHVDQRYGSHPYQVHLDAVAELVRAHGEEAQAVAYLHDVVEDTPVTIGTIVEVFGQRIADCVALLTDEPGDNRKERKRKTYAAMARAPGDLELALVVKAADRLANMRACVADGKGELLGVYKQEHASFQEAAYREGLCPELWSEMAEICASAQHGG
jgi:(p)ppGpp synthase/HD superfamily hydrolase